jgi:hypothetical protein
MCVLVRFLFGVNWQAINALQIIKMSFDTSQRLEGYRGGQPHTTAGASTKLALVDLNAEIDAVFRIFRSENDHNVVCLQDHYTTSVSYTHLRAHETLS